MCLLTVKFALSSSKMWNVKKTEGEEAGLDRFGSASLSRGLVPDPDFLVPGHLRRSEASRD